MMIDAEEEAKLKAEYLDFRAKVLRGEIKVGESTSTVMNYLDKIWDIHGL